MAEITRRHFLKLVAGSALFGLPACSGREYDFIQNRQLVLVGRVLVGEEMTPVQNGAVLIDGGKIIDAGLRSQMAIPEGARLLDLGRMTIMPGIINAHLHKVAEPLVRREKFLSAGVTTVCDVGSALADMPFLARDHDSFGARAAHAQYSGPIITAEGGYPGPLYGRDYCRWVKGAHSATMAANQLMDRGANIIKISFEPGPPNAQWPMLTVEEARAVVRAAHSRNRPVRCHVEDLAGLKPALDSGVDVIEHTCGRWTVDTMLGPVHQPMSNPDNPAEIPREYSTLLHQMAHGKIAMVPTLEVAAMAHWDHSASLAAVRSFSNMGGILALGTDYPFRLTRAGMPMQEMSLMAQCGLSQKDILISATKNAAHVSNCGTRKGLIKPGMDADLIAVNGDPLSDLGALSQVRLVVSNGRPEFGAVLTNS